MRTFELAPLYRSTVGFDRLFDLLDSSSAQRPDWPPYDIEKKSENEYWITMAVAGLHGASLMITGKKKSDQGARQMLHHGIAGRNFNQTFNLADHVKVAAANLENGLLTVDLVREVPEELKPRRIEVGSGKMAQPAQANHPQRIGDANEHRDVV